jgi:hypothetical protein
VGKYSRRVYKRKVMGRNEIYFILAREQIISEDFKVLRISSMKAAGGYFLL